ncbi:miab-like tRNA modifying enzyme ylig, partial [Candidatus Omnitrophus magneticus]
MTVMIEKSKKIFILTLGCPRNLIDSEIMEGLFKKEGFEIVINAESAGIAVVNTCGFIQDAKKESIDMILELAELKKKGKLKELIVTGCLSQRYPEELLKDIKEIDAVFGSADFNKIPAYLKQNKNKIDAKMMEVSKEPNFLYDHTNERVFLTPKHYAYLKIQEGCLNNCSYCVIPKIRGRLRSREMSSILLEAKKIKEERGAKELIIIGQDITAYGIDRHEKNALAKLVENLSPIAGDGWLRLLYTHPAHFTPELIRVISSFDNVCKYVDIPIQHINDRILKEMNRHVTRSGIEALISDIRREIKESVIRTSIILTSANSPIVS